MEDETLTIQVPQGDQDFDQFQTGGVTLTLHRSEVAEGTGPNTGTSAVPINAITAFIDGSMVYGSDEVRAAALRSFEGGRLAVSEGDLLPFNTDGLDNAMTRSETHFLAGDVRANENIALTSMHTLFVREHNRLADQIAAADPSLNDEAIYQRARSQVIGQIQAITYNEFLPALFGVDALGDYQGYDPTIDPGVSAVFSSAAFRFGHSALSSELLRLGPDGQSIAPGNVLLRDAFFRPDVLQETGMDPILRGLAVQTSQEVDVRVIDDLRNFLFGPPGAGGLDLASLNIMRGRDHGQADYNQVRVDFGLEAVGSFSEITSDPVLRSALELTYGSVDRVDAWVGMLAEDNLPGTSVGELQFTVLADQFLRLRDGDRFWYENIYSGAELDELRNTTLADVIARNTTIAPGELQENVFFDDSVIFHDVAEGSLSSTITVSARLNEVQVIDPMAGGVVASRPLGQVSRIVIQGASSASDRFRLDLAGLANRGIDLEIGGGGGHDLLTLFGTGHDEEYRFGPDSAQVESMNLNLAGIDQLEVIASGVTTPSMRRDQTSSCSSWPVTGMTPSSVGPARTCFLGTSATTSSAAVPGRTCSSATSGTTRSSAVPGMTGLSEALIRTCSKAGSARTRSGAMTATIRSAARAVTMCSRGASATTRSKGVGAPTGSPATMGMTSSAAGLEMINWAVARTTTSSSAIRDATPSGATTARTFCVAVMIPTTCSAVETRICSKAGLAPTGSKVGMATMSSVVALAPTNSVAMPDPIN